MLYENHLRSLNVIYKTYKIEYSRTDIIEDEADENAHALPINPETSFQTTKRCRIGRSHINRIPYAQVDFAFTEGDCGSATQEVGSNFERRASRRN